MNFPVVLDKYGQARTRQELLDVYGDVRLDKLCADVQVAVLREDADEGEGFQAIPGKPVQAFMRAIEASSTLIVTVFNSKGLRLKGIKVAFWWPDAHLDPKAVDTGCGYGRAIVVVTDEAGEAHFSMGPGANYVPDVHGRGPHAVWLVVEGPDGNPYPGPVVDGLGMLGGTNHAKLNPTVIIDPIDSPVDEAIRLLEQALKLLKALP